MDITGRKRVLVTGGAGFLGSHLCEHLLAEGCDVLCVDNFFTGRKRNVAHLLSDPHFELLRHDVTVPLAAPPAEVDAIFNLACPASPVHYQHDPIHTTKTSVLGALNLLDLAKGRNARILQASTSEVYGDPQVHPQTEGYWGHVNPLGVRACYDEGKRCAETLFMDYRRQYGVDARIARIFNTYGPRMCPNDGRVVSNFIMQALAHRPLTVYGDGTQTRSFCYVDDMIDALDRLMRSPEGLSGPVNLGNPGEYTMLELAEHVIALCKSRSTIVFRPLPGDDPKQRRPDISLARNVLGWEPTVGLAEGLARTIEYFRQFVKDGRQLALPPTGRAKVQEHSLHARVK
jgi:UDP-glucuronate decarboxylase